MFATDDGSVLQGPAHGNLIHTQRGEWWITYHTHELSHYSLGRMMGLEAVRWTDDGWWRPVHGRAPVLELERPDLPACDFAMAESDAFSASKLGLQWFFHTDPDETGGAWSLTEKPGWLRVRTQPGQPIVLTTLKGVFLQRVTRKRFAVSTRVVFDATSGSEAAGLCLYHDPGMNVWLTSTIVDRQKTFEVGKTSTDERSVLWRAPNPLGDDVTLKIEVDGEERATFFYAAGAAAGAGPWTQLGESIYFGDSWKDLRDGHGGDPDLGWVGLRKRNRWSATTFGVFATRGGADAVRAADFDFVRVAATE